MADFPRKVSRPNRAKATPAKAPASPAGGRSASKPSVSLAEAEGLLAAMDRALKHTQGARDRLAARIAAMRKAVLH